MSLFQKRFTLLLILVPIVTILIHVSGIPKGRPYLNEDQSTSNNENSNTKDTSSSPKDHGKTGDADPFYKRDVWEPRRFEHCAVAADHELCSKIGRDILKQGGSAVDAAIATHCCVETVNSHSTGIGGGGFMLVYDKKSGKSSSIDFRESLPYEYQNKSKKTQGETILVPGVLKGFELAHKKYGKLSWASLFVPAIKLCEKGFKIHPALAHAIEKKKDYIGQNKGLKALFAPNGKNLKEGDLLKRPKLAKTFARIANKGADVFYKGDMAKEVIHDIRKAGGSMSLTDLSGYRAIERGPLKMKVRNNLTMLSTPPPGSGALIALALKIMDGYNWTADSLKPDNVPLTYHRIVESLKFAYAPFTFLGDPRFTKYTSEVVKYMLDDQVAQNMRARIGSVSHTVDYYGPYSSNKRVDQKGTSHISILGPKGDAVSLTSTVNAYFGSKLMSETLGIVYNNELADFSEFWPSVYNLTKDVKIPGKRPMSKSSPIIFIDEKRDVKGVFGAAGGFFIPSALTMSIANWLFFKDNIKIAVSRPRLHCQLFPPTVVYEPSFPSDLIPKLQTFSHAYVTNSTYDVSGQLNAIMGVVQAVCRDDDGKITAECDYRKGGIPAGF